MSIYAILGAAGKIGFSTSTVLRDAGLDVRAILRNEAKEPQLRAIGCSVHIADFQDVDALVKAIGGSDVVQIILPPALLEDMLKTGDCIVNALQRVQPRRVLAISDYGAHVPEDIGMPSVFHTFEEQLSELSCEKIFLRSAEHIENWGRLIPQALETSTLPTFHSSPDTQYPTVSTTDVGRVAARLLMSPPLGTDIRKVHVEGPSRYSDNDIAIVLSKMHGVSITAKPIPRSTWEDALTRAMPPTLANLLIKANDAQNEGGLVDVEPGSNDVQYGSTKLEDALRMIASP